MDFADLVFHVLAHVAETAPLPASLFDPQYVEFARGVLGPIEERSLGEDVRVLGELIQSHERLSNVQRLAWLHESIAEFELTRARALSEVTPAEVARPDLLFDLQQRDRDLVEILRCAVALELPHYQRLPRPRVVSLAFSELIGQCARAAPRLAACRVQCIRALCRRGRLFGQVIWVGLPESEVGPSAEHAAIQAAHEATLAELIEATSEEGLQLAERELERAALWLLAKRCRIMGFEDLQRRWFRTLVMPEGWRSSRPEDFGLAALSTPTAELALACLSGTRSSTPVCPE